MNLRFPKWCDNRPVEELRITLDNTLPAQADLRMNTHIRPILASCSLCHSAAGAAGQTVEGVGMTGIPVFWDTADDETLHADLLRRINFRDPERSELLLKPSNYGQPDASGTLNDNLHRGGIRSGFDINGHNNPGDNADYNTFLNWILAGAVR